MNKYARHRKADMYDLTYMWNLKKVKLIGAESRSFYFWDCCLGLLLSNGGQGMEWEDVGQSVQKVSCKLKKFWRSSVQYGYYS